jgi:molybdopterin-guanine dinucleotide biosynthesis protein A
MTAESRSRVRGYVLAGGASARFGRDKALVEIDGKPMITRMCELLADVAYEVHVVAAPGKYASLGIESVADRWPGDGPLGGIITALMSAAETDAGREWNLMIGCDMPFLTREWLSYLAARALASQGQVVTPRSKQGLEPLCACWRTSGAGKLQCAFDDGVRKVTEAMKHLNMEVLDETHWKRFDSAGRLFWNMNTPADYDEARRILKAEHP